ncbi:hypothetical protein AAVH_35069 [Aphelenchoides avenae]|nr:hypothetical protein AAVH_35069 [Aphelenchus avenae]
MKTVISLFFALAFGVSLLGAERLKCRPKNEEEKKARAGAARNQWTTDKHFYFYVNGKVICPDGSDPEGVVELWEWDMPNNEDDQAQGGWCGYQ